MKLLHANDERGRHAPSWYAATAGGSSHPMLERHVEADVCIVGGGYTGLAAARELALRGHSVVLLEAHRVGWGASGRNGGQLGSGFNVDQPTLERTLGLTRAHALWDIAEQGKRLVRELDAEPGTDLQYRAGIIDAAHRARDVAPRHRAAEHLAREYGHDALEPLDRAALRALVASDDYHGGVLDHGAGHLHPLRLAHALADAAGRAGATLHEHSEVLRIEGLASRGVAMEGPTLAGDIEVLARTGRARPGRTRPGRTRPGRTRPGRTRPGPTRPDRRPRLVTAAGSVRAEHVVLAANGYLDALVPGIARHVMPINNFILVTEPLGERARALLPGDHAVADSRFVVNYFRRTADDRLLFGGGESYGYRFPRDMARRTRRAMLGVFPDLADVRIGHAWGGTLAITPSRLPHVARLTPGLIAAGGYSGHGVGLAIATGQAIGAALDGEDDRLTLLEALPTGRFPGGRRARTPLLALAMTGARWLDRL